VKALSLILLFGGIAPLRAALEFETPAISVDAGLEDKSVTRDYKFTNRGEKAVSIKSADAGCTCLGVVFAGGKRDYAPGESGVLRATFELGSFQGTVDKQISIWLEGDPEDKPSSTLTMSVRIPVIISLEPKSLKWQIGEKADTKSIDVVMNHLKPIHIISVQVGNGNFAAKLITIEDGKRYKVEVTPTAGTAEGGLSIVRIETDADVEKHRIQQAFAVVAAQPGKP
jgi:hypothetical protein